MAYSYYYGNHSRYGYCKITRNGISYDEARYHFKCMHADSFRYDYGTKNENLLSVIDNLKYFDQLYIIKLNDLGYQIEDVLDVLNLLIEKDITLVDEFKEIDISATYDYISEHFGKDYYINFDKHCLPIYREDKLI